MVPHIKAKRNGKKRGTAARERRETQKGKEKTRETEVGGSFWRLREIRGKKRRRTRNLRARKQSKGKGIEKRNQQ